MSDYEFRCPDCKKITCSHSTGNVPEVGSKVECISCGRISIVEYTTSNLEVAISNKKVYPSQLDKLNKEKFIKKKDSESNNSHHEKHGDTLTHQCRRGNESEEGKVSNSNDLASDDALNTSNEEVKGE